MLRLQTNNTLLILAKIVTSDPQVGNGIQFLKMLPEDVEELRIFLDDQKQAREKEAAEKEAAQKSATEKTK